MSIVPPEMDVSFKNSIDLLLTSVAMEEMSISKLIDAEKNKVLFMLKECRKNTAGERDFLDINDSVNNVINNLVRMDALLQSKLELIKGLIPKERPCNNSLCREKDSRTQEHCSHCSFMGRRKGMVSNSQDEFNGCFATLCASVSSSDWECGSLSYNVAGDCGSLYMKADPWDIKLECPSPCDNRIRLWGGGRLTKNSGGRDSCKSVYYELSVLDSCSRERGFEITIKSPDRQKLLHYSGFVIC